ncbi:hypothetical protein [Fodinibius salsisoli]|uniref:Lipoprotein n=1 Tax=Fodinibius salsisoli TaxID=2820877 RepID=A0ABT3PM41_9BACT|nr:hypothetical protein [Fodinibius salsisoli]MCW9706979.1 hypothetical protein [Fodinibius salsisoli]
MGLLNGKEHLIIVFLIFLSCTRGNSDKPDGSYQEMVLEKVINEPSIQSSPKVRDTLYLLENDNIQWAPGTTLNVAQQTIKVVPQLSDRQKVLEFNKFNTTDSTISIDLSLFSRTNIYLAKYEILDDSIKEQHQEMMFIKQGPPTDKMMQSILNNSLLSKYLHPALESRSPLYLLNNQYVHEDLKISYAGHELIIVDDTSGTNGHYLETTYLVPFNRKADFAIYYKIEDISVKGTLKEFYDKWKVVDSSIIPGRYNWPY